MKKTNKLLIIFSWLLVIAIITIIFSFSIQNNKASSSTSDKFVDSTIGNIGNGTVIDKIEEKFDWTDFMIFIRKLGHFFEFAALGFALFNAIYVTFELKKLYIWLYATASSIIIASIDEIIQIFSGRNSSVIDVLIDTLGALCGAASLWLLQIIYFKIKRKKARKKGLI